MGYKSKYTGKRIDDAVEKVDYCVTTLNVDSRISKPVGTQVSFMDLINPLNKLYRIDNSVNIDVYRCFRETTAVENGQSVTKYLLCLYYFDSESVMHEMEISLGDNGLVYTALHAVDKFLGKTATAADSSKLGGVAASSYITSIDVTSVLATAVNGALGSYMQYILKTNVKLYATQDGAVIDVMRSYHDGYVYLYYHIGARYAYMAIRKSDGVVTRAFA